MLRRFAKKRVFVGLTIVAALALAGGAYAYFTSSGVGTGTANVGTSIGSGAISLTASPITGTLYPGVAGVPVTINVGNNDNANQHVGTVSLASITSDKPGCDVTVGPAVANSDPAFTMAPVVVNQTLAPNKSGVTAKSTLTMNDTGASQDACQGATLTLHFTSN